jgi:hypothetical protein
MRSNRDAVPRLRSGFRDPKLANHRRGALGQIAVTLFTWSDWNIQETLVPGC